MLNSAERYDVWLTPVTGGNTVDDVLSAREFASEVEESVTRHFLEAAVASFYATRIVPLATKNP
jgi:hypothetical protein